MEYQNIGSKRGRIVNTTDPRRFLSPTRTGKRSNSKGGSFGKAPHWWFLVFFLIYLYTTLHIASLNGCSQSQTMLPTTLVDPSHRKLDMHSHDGEPRLYAEQPIPRQQLLHSSTSPWTPRDSPQVVFHEPFLSPPTTLANTATVVIVLSKFDHFSEREGIRKTWAHTSDNVFFVVGHPVNCNKEESRDWPECNATTLRSSSSDVHERLRQEQEQYSDLMEIPMDETYGRLPEKILQAYDWVLYSFPHVNWIVKVDDDMYCQNDALRAYLDRFNPNKPIVMGDIQISSPVWSSGKWAETDYKEESYPHFPIGSAGHVVSRRVAHYLAENSNKLFRYQGEDTSLGIWLDGSNLTDRVYINAHNMFYNLGGTGLCGVQDMYIIGHNFTASDQLTCHEQFAEKTKTHTVSRVWIDQPYTRTLSRVRKSRVPPNASTHRGLNDERARWTVLLVAVVLFYNRKTALTWYVCRCTCLVFGVCLLLAYLMVELSGRSSLQPLHEGPPKLYVCGWTVGKESALFVANLFPGHEYIRLRTSPPVHSRPEDLLIMSESYGPECSGVWRNSDSFSHWLQTFRGKVLQRNGENNEMDRVVTGRPDEVYELGHREDDRQHMRFRYLQTVLLEYGPKAWEVLFEHANKPRSTGKSFLIYAQRKCHDHRERAFDLLASIELSDYGGPCKGYGKQPDRIREALHVSAPNNSVWVQNKDMFSSYRFCLVMENTSPALEGYITEKILNAFLAGCIPIYWGPPEIFNIFNRKSFVFFNVDDPTPALTEVQLLETNREAYEAMQREPILANGTRTIEEYFSFTEKYGSGLLAKRLHAFLRLPPLVGNDNRRWRSQ